jgi:uncharacterized protein (TIGR02328 family)
MRLLHQFLIPHLPRQQLLGQHRELCALRGAGWGRKHATVDYVFTHEPERLVAYHVLVMDEMRKRGYNPDKIWYNRNWRGNTLQEQEGWCNYNECLRYWENALEGCMIYCEHNEAYLQECLDNLAGKGIIIDKEKL